MADIAEFEQAAGLVGLANGIEKSLEAFGHVTLSNDDWRDICCALRKAAALGDAVVVPMELTAENGAKYALSGEFYEDYRSVDEDGEFVSDRVPVSWTTIKEIHRAIVAHFEALEVTRHDGKDGTA